MKGMITLLLVLFSSSYSFAEVFQCASADEKKSFQSMPCESGTEQKVVELQNEKEIIKDTEKLRKISISLCRQASSYYHISAYEDVGNKLSLICSCAIDDFYKRYTSSDIKAMARSGDLTQGKIKQMLTPFIERCAGT